MPSGGSGKRSGLGLEPTAAAWEEAVAEQAGEVWEPWLGAAATQLRDPHQHC